MSIIAKLISPNFEPSRSEIRIIKFLRDKGLEACYTPIDSMAQECEVSRTSISRLAKKFGYPSLRDFRIAYAKELGTPDRSSLYLKALVDNKAESAENTLKKLVDINIAILQRTAENLNLKIIEVLAKKITRSGRVFFLGIGNSGFVAQDSAYKFNRIGIDARAITDSHSIQMQSTLMKGNDIVVVISNSGETKEIIKATNIAIGVGAIVVAITSKGESTLLELAKYSLTYEARESIIDTGSINSKISVFFIIDILFVQVIKIIGKKAIETKEKTAMVLEP